MTKLTKKQRHQVKSRWYYIFWGAATISVFAGQMYVGTGYREWDDKERWAAQLALNNALDILEEYHY